MPEILGSAPHLLRRQIGSFLLGMALGSVPAVVMILIGIGLSTTLSSLGTLSGGDCTPAPTVTLDLLAVFGVPHVIEGVLTIRLLHTP
jgi:hypothetical protein